MLRDGLFRKGIVFAVIVLFVGASAVSSISGKSVLSEKKVLEKSPEVKKMNENDLTTLNEGLVAHWRFDEGSGDKAYDATDNHNDGTLINMDINNCWVDGKNRTALKFDGVDDYVYCGNDTSMNPTDGITICGWTEPQDSNPEERSGNFVGMDSCGYYSGVWTDRIHFGIYDPEADQRDKWDCVVSYYARFQSSAGWVHVALTYNSSDRTLRTYLGGTEVKSMSTTGGDGKIKYQNNTDVFIGMQWKSYFRGTMDDVRIYNRALSKEEIEEIINEVSVPIARVDDIILTIVPSISSISGVGLPLAEGTYYRMISALKWTDAPSVINYYDILRGEQVSRIGITNGNIGLFFGEVKREDVLGTKFYRFRGLALFLDIV